MRPHLEFLKRLDFALECAISTAQGNEHGQFLLRAPFSFRHGSRGDFLVKLLAHNGRTGRIQRRDGRCARPIHVGEVCAVRFVDVVIRFHEGDVAVDCRGGEDGVSRPALEIARRVVVLKCNL